MSINIERLREIKFKALTFKYKVYSGNLTILTIDYNNIKKGYYISNTKGMPFAHFVIPYTVSEYTGLKDCYNNKIYENDIVHVDEHYVGDFFIPEFIGKIIFNDGSFCIEDKKGNNDFELTKSFIGYFNIKIIGNYFDKEHNKNTGEIT